MIPTDARLLKQPSILEYSVYSTDRQCIQERALAPNQVGHTCWKVPVLCHASLKSLSTKNDGRKLGAELLEHPLHFIPRHQNHAAENGKSGRIIPCRCTRMRTRTQHLLSFSKSRIETSLSRILLRIRSESRRGRSPAGIVLCVLYESSTDRGKSMTLHK